jgi:hypothetical protein
MCILSPLKIYYTPGIKIFPELEALFFIFQKTSALSSGFKFSSQILAYLVLYVGAESIRNDNMRQINRSESDLNIDD